ncbi:MAG TPA: glycerophosphodiester phosphodiesterase [Acidimicrobiia bacterium]|nr:glycerophosphodiester phosphodiesterase [Acidimicrobiia bacterium]
MPDAPPPTRVWAHRGARRQAPENTVAAFLRARDLGADGVELDVRRSADDGLVVHHDATARGVGVLADAPLAAIRAARPEIPTLEEALDACAGMLVNVEVKNLPGDPDFDRDDRIVELLADALARRGHADDVLVSSFNLVTVDRFRQVPGAAPTALLTLARFEPLAAVTIAADRGHAALHPNVWGLTGPVAAAVAAKAHGRGLALNVWTVNRTATVRRLARAGVDTVVTDVPDRALTALGRPLSPPGAPPT